MALFTKNRLRLLRIVFQMVKVSKMHKVTVRMDRVFDVLFTSRDSQRMTHFSFESQGKRHFGVWAYGEVQIKSGQTVTALIKEPGNWKTLEAFVIHETGEVSCFYFPLKFGLGLICISVVFFYFLMIDSDIAGLGFMLAVHLLCALAITWRAVQAKQIRQALFDS